MLKRLDAGDVLVVTRLDRLARSTRDLLNILDTITKAGAGFKSLGDAWADTTTPHGRLMLTVLGGLAEFERELILARTGDGRARAKARGVKFGRPPSLTPTSGRKRSSDLLRAMRRPMWRGSYAVSQATISRLASRALSSQAWPARSPQEVLGGPGVGLAGEGYRACCVTCPSPIMAH